MLDYSETIEVYDIKVGLYSKLNEYIEIHVYMYQRSRSFFDLCPRSFSMKLDLNNVYRVDFIADIFFTSYSCS